MSGLELGEEFERSLIWHLFKAFNHFRPMPAEDLGTSSTGFVIVPTIGLGPNDYASFASPFAPITYSSRKSLVLFSSEPPWKLDAQLLEQLRGTDVWKFFKTTAGDGPSHADCLDFGAPRLGVDRRWPINLLRRSANSRSNQYAPLCLIHRGLLLWCLLQAP